LKIYDEKNSFYILFFYMRLLENLWNNQPTIVVGIGVAFLVLLWIYINLFNTYQY